MSRKVICQCVIRGCASKQYLDPETHLLQPGNRISITAHKQHLALQARNVCLIEAANGRNDHDTDLANERSAFERITRDVIDFDLVQSMEQLSVQPRAHGDATAYDCARFYHSRLNRNPAHLLVNLKTALFYIMSHCSLESANYLLALDRQLIEIVASKGLVASTSPRALSHAERFELDTFPTDIQQILRHLMIDPELTYLICCPDCFALYPDDATAPETCLHRRLRSKTCQPSNDLSGEECVGDEGIVEEEAPGDSFVCNADLFKSPASRRKPIRRYAFQNLLDWIARLFSRDDIEDAITQTAAHSRLPYDPAADKTDIQDSRLWKQFCDSDGQQFTARDGNITFGMFMDGINPYGNRQAGKHVSITFIILVCLTLPVSLRYRPENIFLVGIAPGPKEPSLEQVNWILTPVVEQLKTLWEPGLYLSRTTRVPQGRLVRAALLPFFADLPALRRSLGFASHAATRMCSVCLTKHGDLKNFDVASWPLRKLDEHRHWANLSREALNSKTKLQILEDHGVRYSILLELSYWNILEYHVVDAMHNLLLGLLKWHCQRFWLMSDVADEKEPKGVPAKELRELLADATRTPAPPPRPVRRSASPEPAQGIPFAEMLFGSVTDPSDADFVLNNEWDGTWVPPSSGKIIFDSAVLSFINRSLKKVHIPTWIERAIPVLGKASFGRLKADEWRNLFTIQLPLILPLLWSTTDPASKALLHNFAHLVSLVNLALKRSINDERINKYRSHLSKYMESSLILFPDSPVAPNHHMAFHLADCLDRFGPCRAWWSFSMERLMGQILKSTSNNQANLKSPSPPIFVDLVI